MQELTSIYNDKNIITSSGRAEADLNSVCEKLQIFDESTETINGLNLDQRKNIRLVWQELGGSSFRNALTKNPNDLESLAKLGPLTYVTNNTTKAINDFLGVPAEIKGGVVESFINIIKTNTEFAQKIKVANVSVDKNAAWKVLGVNPDLDLKPSAEPEPKTDTRLFWGVNAATFSGALMVAGVLATFLGGPIGAGIGIPLFVLGVIGGIASASYIGYVARTSESPESPESAEDRSPHRELTSEI